jgi:hypothetical protein
MTEISDVANLILNMMSGLLPEHLSDDEVSLLRAKFGKNWFYDLGYDDEYKKPKCMRNGIGSLE